MALIKYPLTFYDVVDSGKEFPVLDLARGKFPTFNEIECLYEFVKYWINTNKCMITDIVMSPEFYEKLTRIISEDICGVKTLAGDAVITINPDQKVSVMCFGENYDV